MPKWPVLHVRMIDGVPVATGPSHAAFGNNQRVSPNIDVPTDPSADWTWDGTRLRVRTDRYGFFPIFYCADADGIRVSPSLVALIQAGAPQTLDYTALAVLLRVGFLVGEDTPFAAIRILPAHGVLTWEAGRLEVTGSYVAAKSHAYTRAEAVDGYVEHFRAAIRRPRFAAYFFGIGGSGHGARRRRNHRPSASL